MQMDQFIELISKELMNQIEDEVEIKTNVVLKNNGIKMTGISILSKGKNIAPTLYLDDFLKRYKNGDTIQELATDLVKMYEHSKSNKEIDASFFSNYETVKNRILFRLVNAELNKELLNEVPHHPFLDLEMVYYYLWEHSEFENATILIRNEHLKMWNVNEEDLYVLAKVNTERELPAEVLELGTMLKDMSTLPQDLEELYPKEDSMKLHVATNKNRLYGASTFLYRNVVQQFACTYGRNVYILPSSVHELIFMLDDGKVDPKELNAMVREVNETQLDPKEVLANHVYYYERQYNMFSICQ